MLCWFLFFAESITFPEKEKVADRGGSGVLDLLDYDAAPGKLSCLVNGKCELFMVYVPCFVVSQPVAFLKEGLRAEQSAVVGSGRKFT